MNGRTARCWSGGATESERPSRTPITFPPVGKPTLKVQAAELNKHIKTTNNCAAI